MGDKPQHSEYLAAMSEGHQVLVQEIDGSAYMDVRTNAAALALLLADHDDFLNYAPVIEYKKVYLGERAINVPYRSPGPKGTHYYVPRLEYPGKNRANSYEDVSVSYAMRTWGDNVEADDYYIRHNLAHKTIYDVASVVEHILSEMQTLS